MTTTKKVRKTPAAPPKRRIPIAGIAFGAVGVILVLAIVLTGGGEDDGGTQFGEVAVEGSALSPYPQGLSAISDDPALGETIPTITGVDLDGEAMTIGADGRPKAIAFLAHWCEHCQAEVPQVTQWVEETGGIDGVEITSVTTSINPIRANYPPDSWLERENWPADTMRDDESGSAHLAYGGGGFPYWVFVDADGRVVARTAGRLDIGTFETFLLLARDG